MPQNFPLGGLYRKTLDGRSVSLSNVARVYVQIARDCGIDAAHSHCRKRPHKNHQKLNADEPVQSITPCCRDLCTASI